MPKTSASSISLLLPLFNGATYLREQLNSILTQTYTDFELLIIDDGSTDDCTRIAERSARQDPRVRVLPSSGNEGQKHRLVELLRASRAPLIGFADQDNTWHPEKMGRLVDALGNAAMAFGRSELIDASGRPIGHSLIENFSPLPNPDDRLIQLFIPRVSGHALLVRREVVSETAFKRSQPFDWLIGLEALFTGGQTYVDDAVVYHRLHGGNQCNALPRRARGQLAPNVLWAKFKASRRGRFDFFERVEHLAHSSVLDPVTRLQFSRLARICGDAWFQFSPGKATPMSARKLREAMLSLLQPLAGSERDWAAAVDQVTRLTRSRFHPDSLYRHAKALIAGPKIYAQDRRR